MKDRYEVQVRTQFGERIPVGADWRVSDEQRAAAGRETLAARVRALLAENHRICAGQAAMVPDSGRPVLRVWHPRDPRVLRFRLDGGAFGVWAEDDVLHMLWRGAADRVDLSGGLQAPMWPVSDADGLWEASFRIYRLDEAIVSAAPIADRGIAQPLLVPPVTWRGPAAPAPVAEQAEVVAGDLGRPVSVYVPPCGPPRWGCLLADGQSTASFAASLEPAILAGQLPPVLIVGVHSDHTRRHEEYLPRANQRRFEAHMRWVTDEVVPWADSRFGPVSRWTACGYSNGAVWAIAAGQRRPDLFPAVAAFSAGVPRKRVTAHQVRHFLASGLYEQGFRRVTSDWAARVQRSGGQVRYEEWAGGHDYPWWCLKFRDAMCWLAS